MDRSFRSALSDVRVEMALVQLAAVGGSLWLLLVSDPVGAAGEVWLWVVILLGFGLLRILTAGQSLAMSTFVVEPIGTVVFLVGTGGPSSPFLPVALAGIWWAARSRRGSPSRVFRIDRRGDALRLEPGPEVELAARRPTSLVYGASLAVAYVALIVPSALRAGQVGEALEDAIVLIAVWLVSEVWVRSHLQAGLPQPHPHRLPPPAAVSSNATRRLPVDEPGKAEPSTRAWNLTPLQAELLLHLALGRTNREIARATHVSEAAVRYRLTRLYRILGVAGRREAVQRARELPTAE